MKVMKAIHALVPFLLCHRKTVVIFFSWSWQMRGEKELNFLPWSTWPYFSHGPARHGPALFCSRQPFPFLASFDRVELSSMDSPKKPILFCLYSLYLPGALYMLRENQEWNPGLVAVRSVLFPPAHTVCLHGPVSAFLNIHAEHRVSILWSHPHSFALVPRLHYMLHEYVF